MKPDAPQPVARGTGYIWRSSLWALLGRWLWRHWPALTLAVAQAPFFDAKARHEERWLNERLDDYAGYDRRVKRFIPGIY